MFARLTQALCVGALVVVLSGCSAAQAPVQEVPTPPEQGLNPAAGARLAPGLYDLEDGVAQALGTLYYSDLEGGFWTIVGDTQAEGNEGAVIAVIANGAAFESQLAPLEGKTVLVEGKRLEGASIRMAGPEIEITSVEAINDMQGPAE